MIVISSEYIATKYCINSNQRTEHRDEEIPCKRIYKPTE